MSHYIPFSKAIPYSEYFLDDYDRFAEINKGAYKWFFPGVKQAIKEAGLNVDYYIFGHRHTPYIEQNCFCNPFVYTPYDKKSQDRALELPYQSDFKTYFRQGLLKLT